MTPERANRVADFIRSELADIVQNQMRDPRVSLLSITDARVSRDLGVADVYVTSLNARDSGERTELLAVLNGAAGFLRSALAGRHAMRTTPRLRFHYDELIEGGPNLEALIERAVQADGNRSADAEPSAGEREGPAPRMGEPSAGERGGPAPRKREPVSPDAAGSDVGA